jgi:hypothetical protein
MSAIDPRLHEVLDGELDPASAPAEVGRAVERVRAAAAVLAAAVAAPNLEARVMAAIRRPMPSPPQRLVRWLVTPRALTFRVRPVWSLALAAVVALLTLFPAGHEGPYIGEHEGIVQFVGRFPGARSVHVVGTFNDWRPESLPLEEVDHDGVWRATVVLPTGTYEYMFVVDGERWVADRLADRVVADDFGRENSIVIVRPARL